MPINKSKLLALVLMGLFFCPTPVLGALREQFPSDDTIRETLATFVDHHRGAQAVVVGIVDSGGQRTIAYGNSGRRQRPEVDGSTRFEIGSITKTFTGSLLADMILSGEVAEHQDIGLLFPNRSLLNNGLESQTLGDLATHSSGLPRIAVDPGSLSRLLSNDPYRGTTREDVFRSTAFVPRSMIAPKPGTLQYSNLGFALLGRLLEERTGDTYESLLVERILSPLSLEGIATSHAEPLPIEMAQGYGVGGRRVPYWHVDGYAPAGSLIASADEMLVYLVANIEGSIPALLEAQRLRTTFHGGNGIGLGWQHSLIEGEQIIWHDGLTGGFQSFIGFFPVQQRGLVVLANGQGKMNGLVKSLITEDEPSLAPPSADVIALGTTLFLLILGPLSIWQMKVRAREAVKVIKAEGTDDARAKASGVKLDRFDVIRRPLSPMIALILAERLGAWKVLPYGLLILAAIATVLTYSLLVRSCPRLPWRRGGSWSLISRGFMTVLEIVVLYMMLG